MILQYYLNGRLVYPCELVDLYTTDIALIPTHTAFDYMIKSHYLNLILPNSHMVIDKNELMQAIQTVWYAKNNNKFNIAQYKVILAKKGFYTSIFRE